MTLDSTLDAVVADDAVEFTLTVTNAGTERIDFEFTSGLGADFAVYADDVANHDDAAVWRWSDGRLFTQVLRSEVLAPGESIVHTGTWEDPPPGEYTAIGRLETTTPTVEERTAFEV